VTIRKNTAPLKLQKRSADLCADKALCPTGCGSLQKRPPDSSATPTFETSCRKAADCGISGVRREDGFAPPAGAWAIGRNF